MAVDKKDRHLALIVVDVQKKFFLSPNLTAEESRDLHLGGVIELVKMFHDAGRPVIFVVHDGPARGTGSGECGMELLDGLCAGPGDEVVHKTHMNGFNGTDLADRIRATESDTVLICGMYAEHCAMATYWGAWDNGFSPFMAKGAMIAFREPVLESVYGVCRTYDFDEVRENLSHAQRFRILRRIEKDNQRGLCGHTIGRTRIDTRNIRSCVNRAGNRVRAPRVRLRFTE